MEATCQGWVTCQWQECPADPAVAGTGEEPIVSVYDLAVGIADLFVAFRAVWKLVQEIEQKGKRAEVVECLLMENPLYPDWEWYLKQRDDS